MDTKKAALSSGLGKETDSLTVEVGVEEGFEILLFT